MILQLGLEIQPLQRASAQDMLTACILVPNSEVQPGDHNDQQQSNPRVTVATDATEVAAAQCTDEHGLTDASIQGGMARVRTSEQQDEAISSAAAGGVQTDTRLSIGLEPPSTEHGQTVSDRSPDAEANSDGGRRKRDVSLRRRD